MTAREARESAREAAAAEPAEREHGPIPTISEELAEDRGPRRAAGVEGAVLNVLINLGSVKDAAFRQECLAGTEDLVLEATHLCEQVIARERWLADNPATLESLGAKLGEAVKLDSGSASVYNVYGLVYSVMGEDAKAEANFQRALSIAPQDSDIRHNWGWYLCTHGRAQASIVEFEQAVKNPLYKTPEIALVNAGRCSASFGDVASAEQFFRRALAVSPGNPTASYGLALLAYRGKRYDEARGWLRPAVLQANPAPEALYLGVCLERKLNDRQAEMSYTSQLRNRYPDSAEARAVPSGACE